VSFRQARVVWGALGALCLLAAAWWWWPEPAATLPVSPASGQVEPVPAAPAAATPPAPTPSAAAAVELAITPAAPNEPPLAAAEIGPALVELIGNKAVQALLQTEEFPRRFVATVDNLGRSHAPPLLWPVNPTEGRFMTQERDGATFVDADNSQRYTPFVLLVETVNIERAVQLYRRAYPLLQQAYAEIGFPERSFHARLIEVIDLLLATPPVPEPLKVRLTEVRGPIPSTRPWVRYEFDDPALEALAAGQKILLRSGPVNERRLKSRLLELRKALLAGGAPR
jgi:Protein of unknown function (DUF3014)